MQEPQEVQFNIINETAVEQSVNLFNVNSLSLVSDTDVVTQSAGDIDNDFDYGTGFVGYAITEKKQSDNKIIIGGNFTSYFGTSTNNIIRLNTNGSVDNSFVYGTGFNNIVNCISIQSNNYVLVGGNFTSYNGTLADRIIRLNSLGSVDVSFVYGTGISGGNVYFIEVQNDGKILLGGNFTSYNGTGANGIIRLNSDGSIDGTFIYGTGFNNFVYAISVQSNGKILIGGSFTTYNGTGANNIIRLNTDGSIDATFIYGTGFNLSVRAIQIQLDGKILIGGDFSLYNGASSNGIVRLNSNGSIDSSFNYGLGFGQTIPLEIDTNGLILYLDAGNIDSYPQSGSTWFDLSSSNNNGTLLTPTYSTKGGGSFSFLPTVDYVNCGSNISALNLQQLTISFWINPNDITSTSENYLLSLDSIIGVPVYYGVAIDLANFSSNAYAIASSVGDGVFNFTVNRRSVQTNDRVIIKNTWQMITFAYSSAQVVSVYYNGVLVTNVSYSGGYAGTVIGSSGGAGSTRIAHRWGGVSTPDSVDGFLNGIVVYNRPLSSTEVSNLYDSTKDRYVTPIVNSLALQNDGKILSGGAFVTYNNTQANNIIRINPSGSIDTSFIYGTGFSGGAVLSVLPNINDTILSVGQFSSYQGNSANGIVNLELNTVSSVYVISGGSVDYNFFVQGLNDNPKMIKEFEINNVPQEYLSNPVNLQYTDANGTSKLTPFLPNVQIDIFQKAPNRSFILFGDEYVMDINTEIIDFKLAPFSTTILVIRYYEFIKSNLLDVITYEDNEKAKYFIKQDFNNGNVTAEKYWGSKTMPNNLDLRKIDWLEDLKSRFQKVELLQYDTPKLQGGTSFTRGVYADLFGFKDEVKKKFIGITENPVIIEKKQIILTDNKKEIKPKIKKKKWLKNINIKNERT
jgi:uncharacterized delta-60 repeat protein